MKIYCYIPVLSIYKLGSQLFHTISTENNNTTVEWDGLCNTLLNSDRVIG